ncbi:MAG: VOC family protein [Pseudomonadota bacterium]
MSRLEIIELKPFIPARDFERSKRFYQDVGFTLASDTDGIAYFHRGGTSFLLQDFYVQAHAENTMVHVLVEDVDAWWNELRERNIAGRYGVRITGVEERPWRMRDFVMIDPAGVLWRIAENLE